MEVNRIVLGDCQQVLTEVVDGSVDQLVTDPPYGYSFMGKDWDKVVPSVAIWRECLRVLKPGAFAFVMSSPRADVLSRMIVNLSDAGFRCDFTPIYWAYASGFPKAINIGKMIDKKYGRITSNIPELKKLLNDLRSAKGFSLIEMNKLCGFEASNFFRTDNHLINVFPRGEKWLKIKSILGDNLELENKLQSLFEEAEREVIGYRKQRANSDDSSIPLNCSAGDVEKITVPKSKEAKTLDGSYGGFQPKPAVEVIIVAMKPLSEKTFVDQALKNQKGVTWLDDARIPFQSQDDMLENQRELKGGRSFVGVGNKPQDIQPNQGGRFPANLLVSDDCLDTGYNRVSSGGKSGHTAAYQGGYKEEYYDGEKPGFGDSGDFSRYFSLDAWFEKQFKRLPLEVQRTFPFIIEPKASKAERNKNLEHLTPRMKNIENRNPEDNGGIQDRIHGKTLKQNFHPTVKPLDLMTYLITLGSRGNDLILDPFCGSGTTCLAAKMLGRRFIGIEVKEEYVKLADTRVRSHRTLFEFVPPEIMLLNSETEHK